MMSEKPLRRKLEGLGDVGRAFVHIDYEHEHDIYEEHKPFYEKGWKKRTTKEILLFRKPAMQQELARTNTQGNESLLSGT